MPRTSKDSLCDSSRLERDSVSATTADPSRHCDRQVDCCILSTWRRICLHTLLRLMLGSRPDRSQSTRLMPHRSLGRRTVCSPLQFTMRALSHPCLPMKRPSSKMTLSRGVYCDFCREATKSSGVRRNTPRSVRSRIAMSESRKERDHRNWFLFHSSIFRPLLTTVRLKSPANRADCEGQA